MNRGEMRTEVAGIIEDESYATNSQSKIDRQLNRSARYILQLIHQRSGTIYGRGTFTLAANDELTQYPLEGVADLAMMKYLRQTTDGNNALGRSFIGFTSQEHAQQIGEHQRDHPAFKSGVDPTGRIVWWPQFHDDYANEVVTITVAGATSGTFTITLDGVESGDIDWNEAEGAAQTIIEAMSNVGSGNVTVALATGVYTLTFVVDLKLTNIGAITTTTDFDAGTAVVAVSTTGQAMYSINFIHSPAGSWELVYAKKTTEITPGVSETIDLTVYSGIPPLWHDLVNYHAAVHLLGIHNDETNGITAHFVSLLVDLRTTLAKGTASGTVRQELGV